VSVVDIAAASVLAIAALRGLWIGLVRELFSLAALAAACFAVHSLTEPVGERIASAAKIDPLAGQALGGAAVAVGAIVLVGLLGLVLRRTLHIAGLGLADRIAGCVLGTAEGAVVVAVGILVATLMFGRAEPALARSYSLAAFERLEIWVTGKPPAPERAEGTPARPVAAPAKR
jgi:membrane protein required for colicin V production